MISRLEQLSYEERLKEMRLFIFLICLKGVCKKREKDFIIYNFLNSLSFFLFFFFPFLFPPRFLLTGQGAMVFN